MGVCGLWTDGCVEQGFGTDLWFKVGRSTLGGRGVVGVTRERSCGMSTHRVGGLGYKMNAHFGFRLDAA